MLRHAEENAPAHGRGEQVQVTFGGLVLVKLDRVLDLAELELDECIFSVALGVHIGEDLERFFVSTVIAQPTGRF